MLVGRNIFIYLTFCICFISSGNFYCLTLDTKTKGLPRVFVPFPQKYSNFSSSNSLSFRYCQNTLTHCHNKKHKIINHTARLFTAVKSPISHLKGHKIYFLGKLTTSPIIKISQIFLAQLGFCKKQTNVRCLFCISAVLSGLVNKSNALPQRWITSCHFFFGSGRNYT